MYMNGEPVPLAQQVPRIHPFFHVVNPAAAAADAQFA